MAEPTPQNKLPPGWRWASLGEICEKITDGTYHSPANGPSGSYKYVTAKNIKPWGLDLADITFVTEDVHREIYSRCDVRKDDILYVKDGATTGRVTVNPLDEEFSLLSSVGVLRSSSIVLPKYLMYALQNPVVKDSMLANVAGVAITRLTLKKLKASEIPLAPLDQQKRIVAEIEKQFSRLDEAVANLKRVKANLKRYKAAVLKAAVEGRLVETEAELARREGRSFEPGEQLLQRILETRRSQWQGKSKYKEPAAPDTTDLPEVPEGWVWATVSQVTDVASGNTPAGILEAVKQTGDVPWFKVGDMNHEDNQQIMRHSDAWLSRSEVKQLGLRLFPANTVLFPKRGGAIATNKKRRLEASGCADLNVMGITPVEELASYFFAWFDGVNLAGLSDGSSVPQINHKDIEPLLIPIPPTAEQHRIVAEVDRRLSLLRETEAQVDANLQRAERLRQSILSRAFSVRMQ